MPLLLVVCAFALRIMRASALLVVCALLIVCASALLVVCAFALLVVCLCIVSCASVHYKVCVLSFSSGVCLSIACNFTCASALQGYAFLQCSCVWGLWCHCIGCVIPRISKVVEGFNLCKG